MEFVAIDFETANYKRSSICSIGIAIVENGHLVKSFSQLIKPIPNYFEILPDVPAFINQKRRSYKSATGNAPQSRLDKRG